MEMVIERMKALVPQNVQGALANCGGTNLRKGRFAGRLMEQDLPAAEYLRIFHSLILKGGIRKTSAPGRNRPVIERLLDEGHLHVRDGLRVLDIGSSMGVDAPATFELLSSRCRVDSYTLGDLYTKLYYDQGRGLVFDEDGELLQVLRPRSFVSIHFAYSFSFQRFTNLPKRIRPWLLKRRFAGASTAGMVEIPLVHPSARRLGLQRMDVFKPLPDHYDLIICMQLLVGRYFDEATRRQGVENLKRHLHDGGSLVVGATEAFELITRQGPSFERRSFP